ncbi:gypsy type transposase [Tanacetum coccineum]
MGLEYMAKGGLKNNLMSLSLDECDKISDIGICHLKQMVNLTHLSLSKCGVNITDSGILTLSQIIPNIEWPEWDPCRARIRNNRDCCGELTSAEIIRLGFNFLFSTMGTIDGIKFVLTQPSLDALCEKYHIPSIVHPELPGPNARIRNSPPGKFGVYTQFFNFANYQMGLFAFIRHQDPTKVRIGERELREGEVLLLDSTVGRVVELDVGAGDRLRRIPLMFKVEGVNIVHIEAKVPATVTELPKKVRRKRQAANDASSYALPPKRHRDDHGLSGNASASTGGKSIPAIQRLFEESTLAVEFRVMAPIIIPLITSSMTPDSISGTGLRTKHPVESVSALVPRKGPEPIRPSIFKDSASTGKANPNTAGLSHPAGAEISSDSFFIARDMDAETLQQAYVPKWTAINDFALDDLDVCRSFVDHLAPPLLFSQLRSMDYDQLLAEFNVGIARQTCLSFEVRLQLEHELAGRKTFKGKCMDQADWLKERDAEIDNLRARSSLKEVEAAEAIRLRAFEAQVMTLEFATASKDAELVSSSSQVAKISQELSSLQLSRDELHTMAASLVVERDGLARQVSVLNDTCAELHNKVTSYKMFKEQIEKITLSPLERLIGRSIYKGMQDRLATGIEHGKAGRSLENVEAYNPFAEADYVSTIATLREVDFPLLSQLGAKKDACMADIFDLLHLEGSAARIAEANRLQPSLEQLMLPIYQLEDGVVIGETSLSLALDVSFVPPIPAVDAEASERPAEDRSSKIIFKEEELELH